MRTPHTVAQQSNVNEDNVLQLFSLKVLVTVFALLKLPTANQLQNNRAYQCCLKTRCINSQKYVYSLSHSVIMSSLAAVVLAIVATCVSAQVSYNLLSHLKIPGSVK